MSGAGTSRPGPMKFFLASSTVKRRVILSSSCCLKRKKRQDQGMIIYDTSFNMYHISLKIFFSNVTVGTYADIKRDNAQLSKLKI